MAQKQSGAGVGPSAARQVGPLLIFLLIATPLLVRSSLTLGDITDQKTVNSLFTVVVICTIALAAAYCAKSLLFPSDGVRAAPHPAQDGSRDRLARYVVIGGAVGISLVALALLLIIAVKDKDGSDISKTGMSVFTATLPVFSTWVGTVIAFYFTNESFRQAAEQTGAVVRSTDLEPLTRPGTMVPFERIVRYEMTAAFIGARDAQIAAADVPLNDIRSLFQPPGIKRVVLFDDKKIPVFVLDHDLMPPAAAGGAAQTLKDYLDQGANRTAARNFSWTASTATIADGRRLLELRKVTDLFVSQHGRSDEPVIGWVPDDNLQAPGNG